MCFNPQSFIFRIGHCYEIKSRDGDKDWIITNTMICDFTECVDEMAAS